MEIATDVEVAHGVCQSCQILLVEANSNENKDLYTAEQTAAALGASEISNSWGGEEPLADNQAIQFYLADRATELEAARLLIRRAAWLKDQGRRTTRESSIAKLWAAQTGMRACDRAIQIHGGYGYTREFPVERWHRDAKIYDIFEGTAEIQQLVIARAISGMHIK